MLYPDELRAHQKPTLPRNNLVGVERFELPTSCSQSRRATRLRYTPKLSLNETHKNMENREKAGILLTQK